MARYRFLAPVAKSSYCGIMSDISDVPTIRYTSYLTIISVLPARPIAHLGAHRGRPPYAIHGRGRPGYASAASSVGEFTPTGIYTGRMGSRTLKVPMRKLPIPPNFFADRYGYRAFGVGAANLGETSMLDTNAILLRPS